MSLCILKYTLNNVFTNYIIQLHNELSIAQCNDLLNCKLQIALPFEFYYIYASIVRLLRRFMLIAESGGLEFSTGRVGPKNPTVPAGSGRVRVENISR